MVRDGEDLAKVADKHDFKLANMMTKFQLQMNKNKSIRFIHYHCYLYHAVIIIIIIYQYIMHYCYLVCDNNNHYDGYYY